MKKQVLERGWAVDRQAKAWGPSPQTPELVLPPETSSGFSGQVQPAAVWRVGEVVEGKRCVNQLEQHSKDRKKSTWWVSEGFRKKEAQASAAGVLAGAVVGAAPEADTLSLERVPRCRP